jgi:uncharacterized protein with PQ loop repeat
LKIVQPDWSRQRKFVNRATLVVALVEPLGTVPQIATIFRTRNAAGVSISTWLLFVLFSLTWLWFGVVERQKVVVISSIVLALTDGIVVVGGLLYGGKW